MRCAFAPITSSVTALIVTPIVSLLTAPNRRASAEQIWAAYSAGNVPHNPDEAHQDQAQVEAHVDTFDLIPRSGLGKLAAVVVVLGFGVFLAGVFSAAWSFPLAGMLAIGGMLAVFAGGLVRVHSE